MQETQEPAFAVRGTAQMLGLLARFTSALEFNWTRMQEAAKSGYLNAMAAATYLVHKGVPFRKAHEKVGNAVRFCLEKSVELNGLTLEELRQFGDEFSADFYEAITLEAALDCHDVIGGTARSQVREAIVATEERVHSVSHSGTRMGRQEAVHAGA
jgi:argininosuccinate lyase